MRKVKPVVFSFFACSSDSLLFTNHKQLWPNWYRSRLLVVSSQPLCCCTCHLNLAELKSHRRRLLVLVPSIQIFHKSLLLSLSDENPDQMSHQQLPCPKSLVDRTGRIKRKIKSHRKFMLREFLHHNWHFLSRLRLQCLRWKLQPEMMLIMCSFCSFHNFGEHRMEQRLQPKYCRLSIELSKVCKYLCQIIIVSLRLNLRFGLWRYLTEMAKAPWIGILYWRTAAFWWEMNFRLRFVFLEKLKDFSQNSVTRFSRLSSWSLTPGKYSPLSSHPSTNYLNKGQKL